MEISLPHLQAMLNQAAELGGTKALVSAGVIKPFLTQSEAFKLYGRHTVESWIRAGLIAINKDGDNNSKVRLDRIQLEVVAKTNNWSAYVSKGNG